MKYSADFLSVFEICNISFYFFLGRAFLNFVSFSNQKPFKLSALTDSNTGKGCGHRWIAIRSSEDFNILYFAKLLSETFHLRFILYFGSGDSLSEQSGQVSTKKHSHCAQKTNRNAGRHWVGRSKQNIRISHNFEF